MSRARVRAAGTAEAVIPLLREPAVVQGDPRVLGRARAGGWRGRRGGRAGGRAAWDLPTDRGEARRAGDHQALSYPGTAFHLLIGRSNFV